MTVGGAIESLEEDAGRYVANCVDQVAAIDKSTEAFAMLSEATQGFLRFLTARFDEAVRKGLGGRGEQSRAPNFDDQFTKMWREACARSTRQLEIHRFTFTTPSPAAEPLPSFGLVPHKKNQGGKPLARHWDEMWAEIAMRLWTGEFQPQSQADVTRAMLEWLSANNIDAGDSTVVPRARQLWQKIEATK
jgi:hypothetical protein